MLHEQAGTMVGAPDPGVIHDGVAAVAAEADGRAAHTSAAPRKKMSWSEIGLFACRAFPPAGPASSSTGELAAPASKRRPARMTPSTFGDGHRGDAIARPQGSEAEPQNDGVGAGDAKGSLEFVGAPGKQKRRAGTRTL
jgi:hypothetical protein